MLSQPPELPVDYYHSNFQLLLNNAIQTYDDLLADEEKSWIESYNKLDKASQCLLIRLLSRKGEWFRSDKLVYEEIGDITACLVQLSKHKLIFLPEKLNCRQLARSLLTKPEIAALYPNLNKQLPKAELISLLPDEEVDITTLPFTCIQLLHAELMPIFTALFFTNTHQDFTQFVLSDLGLNRFESYSLSRKLRYFNHRNELLSLLEIGDIGNQYYEYRKAPLEHIQHWLNALPAKSGHQDVDKKRSHLINKLARDLERYERFDEAIAHFSENALPPSRERRVRMWEKMGLDEQALALTQDMLSSPYDVDEWEVAQRIERKLVKKLGDKPSPAKKPKFEEVYIELDLSEQRVEVTTQIHYNQSGWETYYLENCFLNGLFGLVFWDSIYAPVQGAFNHAYQYRPLDLYRPEFSENRSEPIETDIHRFLTLGYEPLIERYSEKYGIANPYVIWDVFTPEHITQAGISLPEEQLVELFRVMLSDMRNFRAGQPDLVAFKNGEFKFVEVKGPGDKLQQNQIRWLQKFQQLSVNAEVCYVNYSKKKS
ncbi:putative VRR-NUC domain protein [Vibrio nigripulchritudo SOn1]|uniref:phosphodiesterase I n=1 Tax=Vibrio nigripulchritudo SOn1 TaxID=1238450 RepID=A0AAV2VTA8_9VIBR|nr:VRR-NUC domain-containing protein [Vibrio nigripulchritudo]CCO47926.1 putative VRR-NUC domain protein [Vibrio nigripulchritudo SOn1]